MNETPTPYNEIDAYIATLTEQEQRDLAAAEDALDIAYLLYRARQERGMSQAAAGARAGLKQQVVSRLEQSAAHAQLSTLQRYLEALGYTIDILIKDAQSGAVLGQAKLSAKA